MKKAKEYSDLEKAFLEHLFGEAKGDIRTAMKLAGYNDNTSTTQIVRQLNEEITELAKNYLAGNAPKAVLALLGVIDSPSALGAANKIKAAEAVLNRAGVTKPEGGDVKLNVGSGGVIILPAKKMNKVDVEDDGDNSDDS